MWSTRNDNGPGSSVGIATDYGLDGPGSNLGVDEISRPSRPALGPTQPPVKWVHGVKCGRGVLLTTHPLLVPRSWKSRAIPLANLWTTPACNGITLPLPLFTFNFTFQRRDSTSKLYRHFLASIERQLYDVKSPYLGLVPSRPRD